MDGSTHFASRSVLSCGYNSTKQTGTRENGNYVDTFMLVEREEKALTNVIHVTCGEYFSTFLTGDHLVYSCGQNHHGQCGIGHAETVISPTLVKELEGHNVVNVSCGYYHTIYQLDDGQVWTVGCANDGRLGLGPGYRTDLVTPMLIPQKTFNYEGISKVACGGTYTLFLSGLWIQQ
jgi:alpha-tubulin suppressor-like RCC1 family protein